MTSPKKFNDFYINQKIEHWPGKTITESDNNLFTLLTMNHHPVHIDNVYAKNAKHGQILVVGTYVLSLVVGMTVNDISISAIANLGYQDINHLLPVFINDTIYAKSTILEKSICSSKDKGIIYVKTIAFNQNSKNVLSLKRKVLLPI